MNLDAFLAEMVATPDWCVHKIDLVREAALLVRLDAGTYRHASFLDDRVLTANVNGTWLPLRRLHDAADSIRIRKPLRFIWHSGHVGSTLVSRLLDEVTGVLGIREPLPLRTLAEIDDLVATPQSLIAPDDASKLHATLMSYWSRGYSNTHCVVVKATSSTGRCASRLLRANRELRGIYLNMDAESYLAVLLAGENSPLDLRGHAAERIVRLQSRIDTPLQPLWSLAPGERAAMSWLTERLTQLDLQAEFPEHVQSIDFNALLANPGEWMERIGKHFGLPLDAQYRTRVVQSELFARYSKAPDQPYSPTVRQSILADSRHKHRDAIAQGLAWLARLAQEHEAVASAMQASVATPTA